jgi:hypothetical protein
MPTPKELKELGLTATQYRVLLEENKKALQRAEVEAQSEDDLYGLSQKYLQEAAKKARRA